MLINLALVHTGGQTSTSCTVNSEHVTWVMPSQAGQIGNTRIGIVGNDSIAVAEPAEQVIDLLKLDLIKLRNYDRDGRLHLEHEVFVLPLAISLITKSLTDESYTIKFVDGTKLDVKDTKPLLPLTA